MNYLPPTQESEPILKHFEQNDDKVIYFYGWQFRNPLGLQRYRQPILNYFQAPESSRTKVQKFINALRVKYSNLVGTHIRQTDYRIAEGGKLLVNPQKVAVFARRYLEYFKKPQSDTCFIVCSDGAVDLNCFGDLNVVRSHGNLIEDLLVLAYSDVIIGSNSTYGALASWYGNIPHIVMLNEGIDWNYYKDKREFFQNKYCTMVHF